MVGEPDDSFQVGPPLEFVIVNLRLAYYGWYFRQGKTFWVDMTHFQT